MDLPEIKTSPSIGNDCTLFNFSNTYARLPEHFYARLAPKIVTAPRLIKINAGLSNFLGLDPNLLKSSQGVEILAGNAVAMGSEPLAMAYAGHQFGHFVHQLGDGRANLLGELVARDGKRYDIQLKGSGPTPYSRNGDGRAALGPVLREYIVSEAMAALGVPTTRALAVIMTGEEVWRETVMPGAILSRVASSHLRVGTFQYFASRGDLAGLRKLADYAIERHYPDLASVERPYRPLLDGVVMRHAQLVAKWMLLGFIHGVMNTDNTSISGETLDYGPCAFMEAFEPRQVFSSIDRQGRYAYSNQPPAACWNLLRLAEALLPLLQYDPGDEDALEGLANEISILFEAQYDEAYNAGFRRKLGLFTAQEGDSALVQTLLDIMAANQVDYTSFFRRLCDAAMGQEHDHQIRILFRTPAAWDMWAVTWRKRLGEESSTPTQRALAMQATNPLYIPRNHKIEEVIHAAVGAQDFEPFEQILDAVSNPYQTRPHLAHYALPALPHECVSATYCGT